MKLSVAVIFVLTLLNTGFFSGDRQALIAQTSPIDKVAALTDTLQAIRKRSADPWLKLNCESILRMINSKQLTSLDKRYLGEMYDSFVNYIDPYNPSYEDTYSERRRPLYSHGYPLLMEVFPYPGLEFPVTGHQV